MLSKAALLLVFMFMLALNGLGKADMLKSGVGVMTCSSLGFMENQDRAQPPRRRPGSSFNLKTIHQVRF